MDDFAVSIVRYTLPDYYDEEEFEFWFKRSPIISDKTLRHVAEAIAEQIYYGSFSGKHREIRENIKWPLKIRFTGADGVEDFEPIEYEIHIKETPTFVAMRIR